MGCTQSASEPPKVVAASQQPAANQQPAPAKPQPAPSKPEPPKGSTDTSKVNATSKVETKPASTVPAQTPSTISPPTGTLDPGSPVSPEEVGKYLNQARTNPQSLLPHIEKQLASFKGNMNIALSPGNMYTTNEGKGAWQQAIDFLKKQKPIQPLTIHKNLCYASAEHAIDLAKNNLMGHVGSNGSTVKDRISKYCVYNSGLIGENVAQEFTSSGRNHALEAVVSLIIDDGVSDRGHRQSIFEKNYNYYGASSRQSEDYYLVVINYASENLKERSGVKPPI